MNLDAVLSDEILPRVEKPSRYLGTEVNAVHKSLEGIELRLALVFPDLYDLGLGNLGIHILYAALNRLPWVWCERGYAPALDMERELRSRGLKLFALESRDELDAFDAIGITLQTELAYTNILNLIDLCGQPLRAAERGDASPLFFAGGPAVFNPEPLAPFLDFFVIGDGEDAVIEIAETLRKLKGKPRKARLLALSMLEGVYVPELYPFDTLPDGRVLPRENAPKIRKRITRDLNGATFPTDYIVPFTHQVHDRISLEVLRGCTQGCRFCQAGMVTRPVRERKLERVDELLRRTLEKTGYEDVSLVSLSTCDYSRVHQLVENTVETLRDKHVSVSLPSLRLDSYSVDLSDMVSEERKTGITFAPEAASPRLRSVINKWIPDEELLTMSEKAFARGWDHVKLYFMIGLPTERDDDVLAIADLARRTWETGKRVQPKARVNMGVSTFVPKPFTPFQWAAQLDIEETGRRQDLLEKNLDRRGIKFGRHAPETTWLEGIYTRADRRAADLLEAAWRKGCRFDAWDEHLRIDLWREAIAEIGWDVARELRERDPQERLPWDHIDVLIPKSWFQEDWQRAMELKHAQDCRHRKCNKCGVIDVERDLCASMLRTSIEGRKPEAAWTRKPVERRPPPAPAQKLWIRIGRTGTARYLSHLETNTAWLRALRRAQAPMAYSQGFHPMPRVSYSAALPTGEESLGEYMEVLLTERVDPAGLVSRLQATLPAGFEALAAEEVALNSPSVMSLATGARYRLRFPTVDPALGERVAAIRDAESLVIERRAKQSTGRRRVEKVMKPIDIRPMIHAIEAVDERTVDLVVVDVDGKPGKAREIIPMLTADPELVRVVKVDTLRSDGGALRSFSEGWSGATAEL